jgi:ABC-type phosphate transport system substrate-binding protein
MKFNSARGALSACLITGAAVAALAAPGSASANLLTRCTGASIEGNGSTLQAEAVKNVFGPGFNSNTTTGSKSCPGGPTVGYHESGSGAGYKSWALSDEFGMWGFIGTDNTVNSTEKTALEALGTHETGGKVLTIPVAEGSVAIMVHLPEGCRASSTAAKGRLSLSGLALEEIYAGVKTKWSELTEDSNKVFGNPLNLVYRVKLTVSSTTAEVAAGGFPGVVAGDKVTGTGIPTGTTVVSVSGNTLELSNAATATEKEDTLTFPTVAKLTLGSISAVAEAGSFLGVVAGDTVTGTGIAAGTTVVSVTGSTVELSKAATKTETKSTLTFAEPCNNTETIQTVAREDGSGTTHIFKRWLNWANESALSTPKGNRTWDELSEGGESTNWPTGVPTLKASGSPKLVEKVATTPSSIGYANLADARNVSWAGGFGEPNGGEIDQKFWALVENEVKSGKPAYADPSSDKESGTRADANCADTVFSNGLAAFPPPSVESNWNEVTADKSSKTYPICGLTYDLAFANYESYDLGTFPTTQGEATTVENYLEFVLNSKGGQKEITVKQDYEALPKAVLTKALEGLPLINWLP